MRRATASRCLACYGRRRDRADSVLKNTRSTSVSDLELCRRGSVKQLGTMKCGSLKKGIHSRTVRERTT